MVKWRIGVMDSARHIGEEKKAAVSGSARRKIMDGPMLCRMDGDHVRADEVPTRSSSFKPSAVPAALWGCAGLVGKLEVLSSAAEIADAPKP